MYKSVYRVAVVYATATGKGNGISFSRPTGIKRMTEIRKSIVMMRLMLTITILSAFIDQLSKLLVRRAVSTKGIMRVIEGWLYLTYAENTGMAFGMLRGWNHVFVFIKVFTIVFILAYHKQFRSTGWMKISLGLLMGGTLGNLVDRAIFGYVTDFISVRWLPSFNIADVCIYVGVTMLVIEMFRRNIVE